MINQDFDQKIESEILDYLTTHFGFEVFTPGLDRTRPLYQVFIKYFKNQGTKVVIVAGTNGKGQTAHTLATLLTKKMKNIALWTSPHILSIRERFVFSSKGEAFESSYEDLKWALQEGSKFLEKNMSGVKVSFYEFLFLVFLILAQKKEKIDYLILEVGLGGRLDAVNHFDADCTCITSISRDHQSILGSRYDQILSEKIAVARRNIPLFTNFSLDYLNSKTELYTKQNGIDWRPLLGDVQYFKSNQKMAWEMFKYLEVKSDISIGEFEKLMEQMPLYKGRREIMTFEGKSLIFIGAHNIDGVRRMLQSYLEADEYLYPESLLVSFSVRPIKEVEVMLKSLVEFFQEKAELSVTAFHHPKALDEESIQKACEKVNKGMLNFVFDWKSELKNTKKQTILVCGSYYFIGEVQRFILS